MVLGNLVSDLVASLLTIALQLLSVLNAASTIGGQILGASGRRTGANTSGNSGPRCGGCTDAGSGGKL